MKGKTRRPRFVAKAVRKTLAANLEAKMAERFPHAPDRVRALANVAGTARATIQRILEIDVVGATVDTIGQLANALHCEPYELLMPDRFAHDHDPAAHQEPPATRRPS
jgi:DNA-binding Xre family transcriptional regulator